MQTFVYDTGSVGFMDLPDSGSMQRFKVKHFGLPVFVTKIRTIHLTHQTPISYFFTLTNKRSQQNPTFLEHKMITNLTAETFCSEASLILFKQAVAKKQDTCLINADNIYILC